MKRISALTMAAAICCGESDGAPLIITSTEVAPDGGIVIRWDSEADKIYRIDFARVLTEPMIWHELYTDYPSLGATTFWKDVGNRFAFPPASHPQEGTMRFYRVVEIAANTASKPTVTITSPAQGATLSDTMTVNLTMSSSLPVEHIRLFVDGGEAALQLLSGSEFQLNTCEFPNGERTLLAVVRNSSGGETTEAVTTYVENVAPSALRTLTFDNYISQYRVSTRLFEPAQTETAKFVAKFGGYSDWTLTITNSAGVAVRTVTGTDFSLNFLWDGRGDGGVTLSVGSYGAVLSAEPSAQSPPAPGGGGGGGGPPAPANAQQAYEMGLTSYFVKPPPMPPVKKDGKWYTWEEIHGPLPPIEVKLPEGYKSKDADSGADGPLEPEAQGQTTTINPIQVGFRGSFAIAYQGHHPQGTVFPASTAPGDGLLGTVDLNTASAAGAYPKLRSLRNISTGLESVLSRAGYVLVNRLVDDAVTLPHLTGTPYGGRGTLNEANLGFLCGHGVFGTEPDFTISASGPLQTYYPIYKTGNNFYDWARSSNYDFGGSFRDVNGMLHPGRMRWMCILTCNNLQEDAYLDMYDKEVLPITDDLHLLLGCKTTSHMVSNFGVHFGHALTGTFVSPTPQLTIPEAWFYAAQSSQSMGNPSGPVVFRVAGWPNNFSDRIDNHQAPDSGNPADITFDDVQVFP